MIDFSAGVAGQLVTAGSIGSSIVGADPTLFNVVQAGGSNTALSFQTVAKVANPAPIDFCYLTNHYTDAGSVGMVYDNPTGLTGQQGVEVHFTGSSGSRFVGAWWRTTAPDNSPADRAFDDTLSINNSGDGTPNSAKFTNISLAPLGTKLVLRNECCGGTILTDRFTVQSGVWYFIEAKNTPGGPDEIRVFDSALRPVLSDNGSVGIGGTDNGSALGTVNEIQWGRGGGCCNGATPMDGHEEFGKVFACWTGTCDWFTPPVPPPTGPWSTAGLLSSTRAIDWSAAGVEGGIPSDTWTSCSTMSAGASAATIQAALNSCAANHYVLLSAGTYNLTAGLAIPNNVELRGSGTSTTILKFIADRGTQTGGVPCGYTAAICLSGSSQSDTSAPVLPPCTGAQQCANWPVGQVQGATQLNLDHVTGLSVGSVLILDQPNDTTPPATGWFACENLGTCNTNGGTTIGRLVGGVPSSQQQFVRVTSIAGSGPYQVGITPPVYATNWAVRSKSPGAWWTTGQRKNAGIRKLTVDDSAVTGFNCGSPFTGIMMFNSYNTWVDNVRFVGNDFPASVGNSVRNQVWLNTSARATIQNSYFYGTGPDACQYAIEEVETSDNLIVNNIFQHVANSMIRDATVGTVYAYNYEYDNYAPSATTQGGFEFAGHDAGSMFNLMESNYTTMVTNDDVHGTQGLMTYFRGRLVGNEDPTLAQKSNLIMAASINSYSRQDSFIGNVFGKIGAYSFYVDKPSAPTGNVNTSLIVAGYCDSGEGVSCQAQNGQFVVKDDQVAASLMLWKNWVALSGGQVVANCSDVPSDAIQPCPSVAASLPASFFRNTIPNSWATPWGTPSWPAIGPDVTATDPSGHAQTLPAGLCFKNTPIDASYRRTYSGLTGTYAAGTATVTVGANHGFQVGDQITVTGFADSAYNGAVLVSAIGSTTISYAPVGTPAGASSSGQILYPNILSFDAGTCYSTGGATAPSVSTTTPATNISSTSATVGGTVASGTTPITGGVGFGTSDPGTAFTCTGSTVSVGTPFTVNLSGLQAGTLYHFRACATNSAGTGYGSDATFTTVSGPAITTTSLPAATSTQAGYSASLTVTGGTAPITCAGVFAPSGSGLTVNSNCTVTGTAGTAGNYTANITPTDFNGISGGAQPVTITINPAPLITTTSPLPNAFQGIPYSTVLATSGGTAPLTCAVALGTPPAGLLLTGSTCTLSGTPSGSGVSNFFIKVTDANNIASAPVSFTLTVIASANTVGTVSVSGGLAGNK